jgi:pimeloyl-ACP methyl ester carboxylesterase
VNPVTEIAPAQTVTLPDTGFGPITLAYHEASPAETGDRPAVVFSHGFPELGYSWRYQLPAVADAGFRAIAPDQRGYGGSSAPEPTEAYDLGQLCGDLDGLCEALGIERAIFVGHDWGGAVVWAMPTLYPERVAGVVGVCTPMMPFPTTELLSMLVGGETDRLYMLWFQEPGVAEGVMDGQARLLFERLMRGGVDPAELAGRMLRDGKPDMNPFRDLAGLEPAGELIATPAEIDHYVKIFEQTGFRGGINWYRNLDRNRERYPTVATTDPGVPCLMLAAEWDPALPPAMSEGMGEVISDLERHVIARAGHWVQQEHPEELNRLLVDWLNRRF